MKILVGYDGSPVAKQALKLAQARAKNYGASIEVVYAIVEDPELKYLDIEKVEQMMQKEVNHIFDGNNISYRTHLVITNLNTGQELAEFARQNHIDEIIIGVKRKSKEGKDGFGLTVEDVILNAPCPVVTIK